MDARRTVAWMLEQEAHALLTRVARIQPFSLQETMVPAAALVPEALTAIERFLITGRRELYADVQAFRRWLRGPGRAATPRVMQRRFAIVKLRFHAVVSQFEVFSDAITQRSERDHGVWLSGLDALAADALALPGYLEPPPVICYLDRGPGAAIRRARTRLPGGKRSPIAVVRMPRERMIGHGIASSLVHEVGHQGAALLDLVASLRGELAAIGARAPAAERASWQAWGRWISEIVADQWSIARVGITSTLGLISVVGLPRFFVFRLDLQDPHPAPWIRVILSCAIGDVLYPHPQWARLARLWEQCYPLEGLDAVRMAAFQGLLATVPRMARAICAHRPPSLRGRALGEALSSPERHPEALIDTWRRWQRAPAQVFHAPPSLVFAVLGRARLSGTLDPDTESRLIEDLLTHWALRSTLDISAICAAHTVERRRQAVAAAAPPVTQLAIA
jgi:hypothetical protein